jgi:hypothetical protein
LDTIKQIATIIKQNHGDIQVKIWDLSYKTNTEGVKLLNELLW